MGGGTLRRAAGRGFSGGGEVGLGGRRWSWYACSGVGVCRRRGGIWAGGGAAGGRRSSESVGGVTGRAETQRVGVSATLGGVRRGAQSEGRGSAALVWQSALSPSAAGWGKAAPLPCLRMAVLGGWRRACPLVGVFPRRGRKKPLPRCGWGGRQGLSGALALERTS